MPIVGIQVPQSPVSGLYANSNDLNNYWGYANIAQWSSPNAGIGPNYDQILQCFGYGDADIVQTFTLYGNYLVPLAPYSYGVQKVNYWSVILTGYYIYSSRGLRDDDKEGWKITGLRNAVMKEMKTFAVGNTLQASRRWPVATSPIGYPYR
jgi:hypothetical protein